MLTKELKKLKTSKKQLNNNNKTKQKPVAKTYKTPINGGFDLQ